MSSDFIAFNGKILDYGLYQEQFAEVSKIIGSEMMDVMLSMGMESGSIETKSYSFTKLKFYSQTLDMEVCLTIKKQADEFFV